MITDTLYDETELDDIIESTDIDVVAWVNSACRRTVDFTESDLTTADDVIRLASNAYCACCIMSEQLEGNNITIAEKDMSLAAFRCAEARDYIRMWCANNGVIPAFDDIYIPVADPDASTVVGASFAYAIGTDAETIGSV